MPSTEAPSYAPRRPDETVLYGILAGQVESFFLHQSRRERMVPRFVERELLGFLDCGILVHGFLRVHCDECGKDRLVPFSCKGRGFCPSCGGRRMADTAAHLVDRVLPTVPVRQWVLSLPVALRYRLAYDARLVCDVLRIFLRAIAASLRRRAGVPRRKAQWGAVTFIQRFGGALNLNVHFHTLALDGVYVSEQDADAPPRFRPLPPPDDAEVARVTTLVARRIARLLERRGLGPQADAEEADALPRDEPLLAEIYGASVHQRIAQGARAGERVARRGDQIEVEDLAVPLGPRCASVAGVSVHANVAVPARDRKRLERLCRYAARPPVATERLSLLPDGRACYGLRHRWRDGTTHVVFEPLDLVARLAALVPPPRFHLVRYHGVLAPAARARVAVVPQSAEPAPPRHPGCARPEAIPTVAATAERVNRPPRPRPRNYSWAELMRRVFEVDVLVCPRCTGRMRILAAIHSPEAIRAILDCLGLPTRAPPIAPAADLFEEPEPQPW